ncbi:polysaccharide lyase family 8 protein [Panus rudis PR-1116 ss-1]|nr:polysaccharide lyase family 8 protein [Panus rudis PR-1116 ss-1]
MVAWWSAAVLCQALALQVAAASTSSLLTLPSQTSSTGPETNPGSSALHTVSSVSASSPVILSPPATTTSSESSASLSTIASPSSNAQSSTTAPPQATPTIDPSTLADIQVMTERRLSFIVGGVTNASDISQWLSTLGPNGKWPDSEVDYTTGCPARRANWPAQSHWIRILTMSAAWHGGLQGAEQWTKSPELHDAISRAMDFWFANDYQNPSCLDSGGTSACPCGTPGLWNTNWFSNIILIPNLVSQSCLLLNDTLTITQHSNCTHITGRTYGTFGHSVNGLGIATGANLLDIAKIGIDQGLLNLNASIISDAYSRIHNEVTVQNATFVDGIRADGSFGQHGGLIYNGNYGKDFANDVLFLEIVAGSTQFAATDVTKSAFSTLIDGDQWMIYRNVKTGVLHWDFSVLGRFISFPVIDNQATGSIKINITEIKQLGDEWQSDVLTSVYESLSKNTSNANVGSINGNRMFFANDYMVHRGPGYVTTLRMYSSRTKNTECLNAQNLLGFHLSDGTVYTYMKGTEYEDISVAWDWNLIPGTTVDYGATGLDCDHASYVGLNNFVGGVSDGQIGIGAMRYTNPVSKAFGWQKAWFFLDDNVQHVMIPTINSSSDAPIFSVLDQKRYQIPVLVDSHPTLGNTNFTNPTTLWHDNVGYLFDQSKPQFNISVEIGPKSGNWADIGISTQGEATVDLFAAWIDHGTPADPIEPVSYTVFPATDHGTFYAKTLSTKLRNIQNDADISAVYDENHRTAMFVFWNSSGGSVSFTPSQHEAPLTVAANGNSAVILNLKTGEVTVSDPSQTLSSLTVTCTVGDAGAKPSGWGPGLSKTLTFELPSGGLAGDSVSQKL